MRVENCLICRLKFIFFKSAYISVYEPELFRQIKRKEVKNMALIVCPECGKNFSDRAPACPECGCPTSEIIGQGSKVNAGQVTVANNAFDDGRYEEAYQLFTQLYAQDQSDPQIMVRLALSTVAKDYFNDGIPNSTKDLLAKGFQLAKTNAPSRDALISQMTAYVTDAKSVVLDTHNAILKMMDSTISQTAPTRGVGSMLVDALFAPATAAHRNLYEDIKTAQANTKLLTNAMVNEAAIQMALASFGSYVLGLMVDVLGGQLNHDDPLYSDLRTFVYTVDDLKKYEKLSVDETLPEGMVGLCYGDEKIILEIKNTACYLLIDGTFIKGLRTGKGYLILTNYKVLYTEPSGKNSFEKRLDDLLSVKPGKGLSTIDLVFPQNVMVEFVPDEFSKKEQYVSLIQEELKLP